MLTRRIVVIISQYVQISNYVVHMKLIYVIQQSYHNKKKNPGPD